MTYNTYCTCIHATPMPPGKSTMLSAIAAREVPIPEHIDIFHLTQEIPSTDKTPLQCVMEVDQERWVWQLDHSPPVGQLVNQSSVVHYRIRNTRFDSCLSPGFFHHKIVGRH